MGKTVCGWVRSVLVAYMDGELKAPSARAVRRHLEKCESCRAQFRLLNATWSALAASDAPATRGGFASRMMARIAEGKEIARLEARLRSRRRVAGALAALAGLAAGLVVGLCLYLWTGRLSEPNSLVEREIAEHVTFLEDAPLIDNVVVIKAIERLAAEPAGPEGS
jgi:anti-sigma factor RsiW